MNKRNERAELIQAIRNQLGDDFDPSDCFYEQGLLYRAAAMLEAQPAEQAKGQEAVSCSCAECGKTSTNDSMWALYCLDCIQKHELGTIGGLALRTGYERLIDDYIEDYEFDDGDGGYHAPSDFEQAMIKDAFMGFDFSTIFATQPAQPALEWFGHDRQHIIGAFAVARDRYKLPTSVAAFQEGALFMERALKSGAYPEATAAAQPAREWVGLTPTEVTMTVSEVTLARKEDSTDPDFLTTFARAIESKLREKNAGQPAAMKPWQTMPTVKDRATNRELTVVGVYEDVVFVDVPTADDKAGGEVVGERLRSAAYDQIDRFLRNNLGDDDYAEYSAALDTIYTRPQPQAEVRVPDGLPLVISGAIFDFAGYLTTRKEVVEVGSTANASPMADLVKEWAELRGLSLDDAAVLSWNELLAAAPKPQDDLPAILKKQAS